MRKQGKIFVGIFVCSVSGLHHSRIKHNSARLCTYFEEGSACKIHDIFEIEKRFHDAAIIKPLNQNRIFNCDPMSSSLGSLAEFSVNAQVVQMAFQDTFTKIFGNANIGNAVGSIFVATCLFFFAFSTIISWNFFGEINFKYLFGKKATIFYSVVAIVFVFLGAIFENSLVWGLSDLFNNLMVIPNVMALFALGGMVVAPRKSKK